MQNIAAGELKRRGLAALGDLLGHGPVQVVQRNRPACVVLSVAAYERLTHEARGAGPAAAPAVWDLLLADAEPPSSGHDQATLDANLAAERAAWDRP